jgi:hypothetical protein
MIGLPFDFNPDLSIEKPEKESEVKKTSVANTNEAALVTTNVGNSDVVTVNNLLGLTQSHINDDNECRMVVSKLTEELNNSIQLMSIKDLIDYLKVKIKEREFHVDCIFKAYAFIQKSEFAREMLVGSTRKERIIEVSDRKRITGLLNMLNNTD